MALLRAVRPVPLSLLDVDCVSPLTREPLVARLGHTGRRALVLQQVSAVGRHHVVLSVAAAVAVGADNAGASSV